ncbi:MAG TPA: hypothetical protein VLC30_17570 [Pseudomonas sp.]|nr:hypothetical protein [Pseudomonas sp.]
MSLQVLWSLFLAHPAQAVNGLALFFAIAGNWLLLTTRMREQSAMARLVAAGELDEAAAWRDEPGQRLNRFFYIFAGITLGVALLLSWYSTQL